MAARNTYLQLPPELGGIKFGPFPGAVSLGSDAKRCQVVLDPSHGVYPVHVSLAPTGIGTYSVTPATRDGKVFLVPYGQVHVWPVIGPVQARVGDLLVVGTPHGPRFQILDEAPLAAPPAGELVRSAASGEAGFVQGVNRAVDGILRPATGSVANEVKRRAGSAAIAAGGPLRDVYVAWSRIRTGFFANPYWIVAVLFAIIGVVGTGSVSCTGLAYVLLDLVGLGH